MEFWISKFEKCINKILSLDKETCYELGKFDNQVIAFEFENKPLSDHPALFVEILVN